DARAVLVGEHAPPSTFSSKTQPSQWKGAWASVGAIGTRGNGTTTAARKYRASVNGMCLALGIGMASSDEKRTTWRQLLARAFEVVALTRNYRQAAMLRRRCA